MIAIGNYIRNQRVVTKSSGDTTKEYFIISLNDDGETILESVTPYFFVYEEVGQMVGDILKIENNTIWDISNI